MLMVLSSANTYGPRLTLDSRPPSISVSEELAPVNNLAPKVITDEARLKEMERLGREPEKRIVP